MTDTTNRERTAEDQVKRTNNIHAWDTKNPSNPWERRVFVIIPHEPPQEGQRG